MNDVLETLFRYLKQDSTWRGLIALVSAGGIVISPEQATSIIATGMALVGLINVFRDSEKKT